MFVSLTLVLKWRFAGNSKNAKWSHAFYSQTPPMATFYTASVPSPTRGSNTGRALQCYSSIPGHYLCGELSHQHRVLRLSWLFSPSPPAAPLSQALLLATIDVFSILCSPFRMAQGWHWLLFSLLRWALFPFSLMSLRSIQVNASIFIPFHC